VISGRIAASAQATYWSPSRAGIAWNAIRIVCGDDAQKRSSVHAGTWRSKPTSRAALRPTS